MEQSTDRTSKVCAKCGEGKPLPGGFRWRSGTKGYLPISTCRDCERRESREYNRTLRKQRRAEKEAIAAGLARQPDSRYCRQCKRILPKLAFAIRSHSPDGLSPACRECNNLKVQIKRAALTDDEHASKRAGERRAYHRYAKQRRDYYYRTSFGLTLEQYDAMVAERDGKCDICKQPESRTQGGLVVAMSIDHDHSCCPERGMSCGSCIRGLLCSNCNNMLGLADDSIERLRRAISYLEAGPLT